MNILPKTLFSAKPKVARIFRCDRCDKLKTKFAAAIPVIRIEGKIKVLMICRNCAACSLTSKREVLKAA